MSFVDYLINFVVFLGLLVAGIFIIIFAGAFFVSFETFNPIRFLVLFNGGVIGIAMILYAMDKHRRYRIRLMYK